LAYGDANASYTPTAKRNTPAEREKNYTSASFTIQSSTLQPGQITVPVMANDVQNLGAFQFTITYDPNKLAFNGATNWYKGINEVTVGSQIPGQLTFVWAADEGGISIVNDKLFDLQFTNLNNEASTIAWSDSPTIREYTDWNGTVYEASYVNGMTDVTTSIGNLENASVNIYPNPSNGIFTISFGEIKSSAISLQIINTMGAVVYEEKISSNSPTTKMLNLKELPEGIYSVIIQAYNQRLMKKMTIIK